MKRMLYLAILLAVLLFQSGCTKGEATHVTHDLAYEEYGLEFLNDFSSYILNEKEVDLDSYLYKDNTREYAKKYIEVARKAFRGENESLDLSFMDITKENHVKDRTYEWKSDSFLWINMTIENTEDKPFTFSVLVERKGATFNIVDFYFPHEDSIDCKVRDLPDQKSMKSVFYWTDEHLLSVMKKLENL